MHSFGTFETIPVILLRQYLTDLVYTTQVKSAFRAFWLVSSEVNSKYIVLFTTEQTEKNKMATRFASVTEEQQILSINSGDCST